MMIRSTKQVFRGTAGAQDINYHRHDGNDKLNNLLNSLRVLNVSQKLETLNNRRQMK